MASNPAGGGFGLPRLRSLVVSNRITAQPSSTTPNTRLSCSSPTRQTTCQLPTCPGFNSTTASCAPSGVFRQDKTNGSMAPGDALK